MASTVDNLIATIRGLGLVPMASVNYGITDGLKPPYIAVTDYQHVWLYDTAGPSIKQSTWTITVIDQSQTDAEGLAGQLDGYLNCTNNATPQTTGCLQTAYRVGQMAEGLYQFGVQMEYELTEDMNKGE